MDFAGVSVLAMARTPFGKFGGALRNVDIRDLGAAAIRAAIDRSGLDPGAVDGVVLGVNFPGSRRSVARQAALRAGLADTIDAITVDRACCSSLAATRLASQGIRLGDNAVVVAGGAENLSQVPYFLEHTRFGEHRIGRIVLEDHLVISCPHTGVPRAVQAAEEAAAFGIGRAAQDEWAARSHELYWRAREDGEFAEIFAVDPATLSGAQPLEADESPRRGVTAQTLAALPAVYGSETVTAGNAPGLSTGGCALVLTSPVTAARSGGEEQARLIGFAIASDSAPKIGATPALAARRALRQAGIQLADVHVIEINEAFAAVPLVATLVLADGDESTAEKLRSRTNLRGGAIAIGHPTGATGARLVMSAISALKARGGGLGLVTICGGVAEAESVVLEVGS
jgi:acetyl-CoA C-acetyltransferase